MSALPTSCKTREATQCNNEDQHPPTSPFATNRSQCDLYFSQMWKDPEPISSNGNLCTSRAPLKDNLKQPQLVPQQPPQSQPQLSPYSVVVGRGNVSKNAVGNRRLTVLAKTVLPDYAKATTKTEKTAIVSSLLATVHGAGGEFVKVVDGEVEDVNEHTAREKIGSVLRDLLHDKYRSSSKSRVSKRQRERREARKENLETNEGSADSAKTIRFATPTSCNIPPDVIAAIEPKPMSNNCTFQSSFSPTKFNSRDSFLSSLESFKSLFNLPYNIEDEEDDSERSISKPVAI